jgi:hypothetical protein
MNEILWELINFMFIQPLILIGIIFTVVIIVPVALFMLIALCRSREDVTTRPQLGGYCYDNYYSPYSETDGLDSKSQVEEMIDDQLALEDEERYFGMDYGFLDEVEHLSDY